MLELDEPPPLHLRRHSSVWYRIQVHRVQRLPSSLRCCHLAGVDKELGVFVRWPDLNGALRLIGLGPLAVLLEAVLLETTHDLGHDSAVVKEPGALRVWEDIGPGHANLGKHL